MATRGLPVMAALVAALWLGATAMARHEADEGSRALAAGSGSPAGLDLADDHFERARRFGPDADLYLRQGSELVFRRQPVRATPLLERAVRAEPENAEAWLLLSVALRGRDPQRAQEARRRTLALDPRARRIGGPR